MTIVTMPSSPSFTNSEWGIRRAVAVSESPFTGAQQVQVYSKAQWYATLTLPPMLREQAVAWQAFFLLTGGRANTFLLGDPDAKTAIGTATYASVAAPASVGSNTVNLTLENGATLNTGSYIQFGSSNSPKLHMIVDDNTGSGNVTIEPALKTAITTATPVTIDAPKGLFRMETNDLSWSADHVQKYGITFTCSEAQ